MSNKRYELLENYILINDNKLYQIRALVDFKNGNLGRTIKAGELGGFIQSEDNLVQDSTAWVLYSVQNASMNNQSMAYGAVYENAIIKDDGLVTWGGTVYGNAIVSEDARVDGTAKVHGNVILKGTCAIGGLVEASTGTFSGRLLLFQTGVLS